MSEAPATVMLTAEHLARVRNALEKLEAAASAVQELVEREPLTQPPTERRTAQAKIAAMLDRLAADLVALYR